MPEMISLRTFTLATKTGHTIRFEAKVPRNVPDIVVADAMQAGCVPTDEAAVPFYEDTKKAYVEFQGDVRRSMLYLAVKMIAERNKASDFDAGGVPKTAVVSNILGEMEIGRKEIVDIYQQFCTAKSEDREFALHPHAQNILRVLESESKDELILLADEFGIDGKRAKGLSMKDLRRMLLVKFNGVSPE